jgi:hypothetical protein
MLLVTRMGTTTDRSRSKRACRCSLPVRTIGLRTLACPFRYVLLLTILAAGGRADIAHADEWFTRLPFQQWLSEGEHSDIPWRADVLPAEISLHQRLMLRVVIRLYGSELDKRRGAGEFVTLVQYKDSTGRIWQHHTSMDLTHLPLDIAARQLAIAQYAYVLPGDYSLAIAICDTATHEHGLITRQVHVDRLEADPLPEVWANLPPVDFIPPITEPPDVWYLPGVEGRLNLPVATRRPVHIHLVVNITPSSAEAGSLSALHRNMDQVIPILKVFSQVDVRNGSIDTSLVDLTNLRVAFEQKSPGLLDWDSMRKVFLAARPGTVDAHSLANQRNMTTFFLNEVLGRLFPAGAEGSDGAVPIVIVLSGPATLQEQDLAGAVKLPENPDYRVYYISYHNAPAAPMDDLQRAVVPFNARIYDVSSKYRMREILASILHEISKL